jgi:hypothetical protein
LAKQALAPLLSSLHVAALGELLKSVSSVPSFLSSETPLVPPINIRGGVEMETSHIHSPLEFSLLHLSFRLILEV